MGLKAMFREAMLELEPNVKFAEASKQAAVARMFIFARAFSHVQWATYIRFPLLICSKLSGDISCNQEACFFLTWRAR